VDIIHTVLIIFTALEVMKIFLLFYVRHFAMGLTNVVIKQQFFTFIFTVFLVNLAYSFR